MIPSLQETTQLAFDYGQLDPDVRERTMQSEEYFKDWERRTSKAIVEAGHRMIATRDDLGNRKFKPWVESRLGWSIRTAYNLIAVAERFPISANFAQIAPSALYVLASGTTPEEVREKFVEVAEAGRKVTHADVQDALAERRAVVEPGTDEEERTGHIPFETVDPETGEIVDEEDDDEPVIEGEYVDASDPESFMWSPPASAPAPKHVHVSSNSGENEWYTPPQYIEAARLTLGGIDLDPASNPLANEWIQADTFYTKDDNGLAKTWRGRVWMNPPYAQPLIQHFTDKVVEEFTAGNIEQAVVLVNNATETRWFQTLASEAAAFCFPRGRIKYLDSTGTPANTPLQGQAFVYFGDYVARFRDAFERFGVVV